MNESFHCFTHEIGDFEQWTTYKVCNVWLLTLTSIYIWVVRDICVERVWVANSSAIFFYNAIIVPLTTCIRHYIGSHLQKQSFWNCEPLCLTAHKKFPIYLVIWEMCKSLWFFSPVFFVVFHVVDSDNENPKFIELPSNPKYYSIWKLMEMTLSFRQYIYLMTDYIQINDSIHMDLEGDTWFKCKNLWNIGGTIEVSQIFLPAELFFIMAFCSNFCPWCVFFSSKTRV